MSDRFYAPEHRALQEFDTRRMADLMQGSIRHDSLTEREQVFIAGLDMFFLATADHDGRPTVSYKGGLPGFVRVVDERTLAFPSYDGNGMFMSTGNIAATREAGLLFIDFVQELLPAKDQGRAAQAGGLITLEEYDEKVARGDA